MRLRTPFFLALCISITSFSAHSVPADIPNHPIFTEQGWILFESNPYTLKGHPKGRIDVVVNTYVEPEKDFLKDEHVIYGQLVARIFVVYDGETATRLLEWNQFEKDGVWHTFPAGKGPGLYHCGIDSLQNPTTKEISALIMCTDFLGAEVFHRVVEEKKDSI